MHSAVFSPVDLIGKLRISGLFNVVLDRTDASQE